MVTPFPLGRVPERDPRSLNFAAPATTPVTSKRWRRYGTVLDQGDLGSCTGNAGEGCLNHAPFHVVGTTCAKEPDAVSLYSAATAADAYPGQYPPEDTGSSGLAVAKVLKAWGRITGYTHAFDLDHILSALMSGPLIVGTDWLNNMFYPDPNGLVQPTGSVAGGHEYVLNGADVTSKMLRFQNSWGTGWGVNGHFFMTFDGFSSLLADDGDAILFTR